MKLIIYDKCWDAIINLPKTIQKKIPEFIKKFREDSTSAAIHLEPISTFKDSQLRTARISQKYRAIIRAPKTGDLFHLLWVDNHDEAMDWAKNKIFEWNGETQSYQVFTAAETVQKVQETAPTLVETKEKVFMDAFSNEQLLQIGVPEILLPSIRKINNVNDLEKIEQYIPVEAFENLFHLLDGLDIREIIQDIAEGKVKSEDQSEQELSANNQRSFFHLTDDEVLNDLLKGDLQKWKIFLHPSQRKIVESNLKGSIKVTGGAGTGKTVAALHRAKRLSTIDYGRAGKPILFTTFTNSLTRNLAKEFVGMKIDTSIVKLNNIDGFAIEQAKKLNLINSDTRILDFPKSKPSLEIWSELLDYELTEFDNQFLKNEYKDVILYQNVKTKEVYFKTPRRGRKRRISRKDKIAIWTLVEKYELLKTEQNYVDIEQVYNLLFDFYNASDDKPFGHVIADEIQDFSNVGLRLLRSLVEEKPNDLFLVGDPLQKIYDKRINFSKAGINIRGMRSRRLKINYRTTEEIKRTAISTIKNISFDDFDGEEENKKGYVSLFHGQRPTYQTFKEKNQELDFLVEKIYEIQTEGRFSFSDIAIAARTKNAIKDIKTKLHNEKIAYYDLTTQSGKGNKENGIHLSTFHNMKGLEFKVVLLIDVNQRTLPFKPAAYQGWDEKQQKAFDKRELSLIYVAMTRAVHVLGVSGVGVKSELLNGV